MSQTSQQKQLQKSGAQFPALSGWRLPGLFQIPSLLEDFGFGSHLPTLLSERTGLSVAEDSRYVYVEAALPGLQGKDIDVSIEQGVLWIRGERKEEEEDKEKKYYHRASSSYSYRVALPGHIEANKEPKVTYKDGILKLTFTKATQSQAKKIAVKNG